MIYHRGFIETLVLLDINNYIYSYVHSCVTCQLAKKRIRHQKFLIPIRTTHFNSIIQLDFRGPFRPTPEGYRYNLTIIDLFTNKLVCFPTYSTTVSEIIKSLTSYIHYFGKPDCITNDGGNGF